MRITSGCRPGQPASTAASSPASLTATSTSLRAFSTISSMRAGCIRPSVRSLVSATRAISRRTGSKPDSVTASGVSSMMTSTPVASSRARMLRPSRPMIRPFMSSEGRGTTEVVVCETTSPVSRCMATAMILRPRSSASSFISCSISRRRRLASSRISRSTWARSISLASPAVRLETRSNSCLRCSSISWSSDRAWSSCASLFWRLRWRCSSDSSFRSRFSSFWVMRRSRRWTSLRRSFSSASACWRNRRTSSFASRRISFCRLSASLRMRAALRSEAAIRR